MVGVEQWAEIRRLVLVEWRSQQVAKSLGLARDTVARVLASDAPPKYERARVVSKLDPFKEWICEQLRADPTIHSLRLREMATELGYAGGKSIFDDYVREVSNSGEVLFRTGGRGAQGHLCIVGGNDNAGSWSSKGHGRRPRVRIAAIDEARSRPDEGRLSWPGL